MRKLITLLVERRQEEKEMLSQIHRDGHMNCLTYADDQDYKVVPALELKDLI